MKALIIVNIQKKGSIDISKDIKEYLDKKNIMSFSIDALKEYKIDFLPNFIISIGGDGTVLGAAQEAYKYNCPILAINVGTFGYIAEIQRDQYREVLDEFLEGKARLTKRISLKYYVDKKDERIALNDVVITGSGLNKLISLKLIIDDYEIGLIRSDGFIISSPTGSTGYSLAAGGPILSPSVDAITVVAICPFSLNLRPIVLDGAQKVKIIVMKNSSNVILTADGKCIRDLIEGDEVTIYKSSKKISTVTSKSRKYLEGVKHKLNWGGSF